jgi:hypothetical protein
MAKLVNRAKMTTATTGTGTITLGSAVDGFQTFAAAGVLDTDVVRYVIEDGDEFEIGSGTFDETGGTLTRTVSESSNAGSPINLSGDAEVYITAIAADIVQPGDNVSVLTNDAGYSTTTGTVTSVDLTAGTGISVSGGPITSSGSITVTNEAPDQVVVLTGGTGISTSGTYPNFTITNDEPHIPTNLGSSGTGATRTITSSTGSDTSITYSAADLSAVPTSRVLTAGTGITGGGDLTANRTFAIDSTVVTLTGTQTLTNKTLTAPEFTGAIYNNGSYRGNVVAVPALNIDLSAGNYFTKSISANSTFTFSGTPAARAFAFTLRVTVSGDRTITWPASVEFPGDEAPTLTAGKTHLFMFATDNGGTTFRGAFLADYEA